MTRRLQAAMTVLALTLAVGGAAVLTLGPGAGEARAQAPQGAGAQAAPAKGFPVVTGEHWANATQDEKLAFIVGMTTVIELEKEVQGPTPPKDSRSLIPSWVKGLQGLTLKEIVAALDDVYRRKPEARPKPVVEVLWYEVVHPDGK